MSKQRNEDKQASWSLTFVKSPQLFAAAVSGYLVFLQLLDVLGRPSGQAWGGSAVSLERGS